jgi:hypothetical protein
VSALLRPDAGPLSPAAAAAQQWQALVPALAARRKMRLSYDRGRSYPKRLERALSSDLPPCPAAVHIYDGESTQVLAADFDVKRAAGHGAVDAAGQVTVDAAAFAELIRSCGGRGFGDISPNGGRHGYVLWAAPVPFGEMRRVALALARRFPSLDPTPMLGREHGIIRPPGSRHRTGGFQSLTTSLALAQRCAAQPNGPAVWARLCESLREQLDAIDRGECPLPPPAAETAPKDAQWRLDETGMPWLPRSARRLPRLRQDLELTAVTGGYDAARYPTPSHARFAVLGSAAARGWRLAEVTERMRSGGWDGLAGFFGRYKPKDRAARLAADWKKAVAGAYGENSGRPGHTREKYHAGASSPPADSDCFVGAYQQIRRWDCALRAGERQRWRGAHGITVRLVMRALAAAAQMTGSTVIEFGTRSLGMLACLDHSTVARVLREVCAEDDPYLELLEGRRGVRGDLYMLRVPQAHSDAAAWWRWRPGRLGVHPVFRILGGAAALVCEQLTSGPVRSIDLPVLTGLSATTVSTALADLAAHAIAVRGPGGWRRGPASLDEVAGQLGVPEVLAALQARYRKEREQWLAFLLLVPAIAHPAAPPAGYDVPWPEAPPDDDDWHGEPAAARAPPTGDAFAAAVAVLEDQFGPVLDVTAA